MAAPGPHGGPGAPPSPAIRRYPSVTAIRAVGEGLLAHTLPREAWTHEAHLAACLWLVTERPDIDAQCGLPGIIRSYNEAVGGVNSDTAGYHETITQLYVAAVRHFLACSPEQELLARCDALFASPFAARDWPLAHYSRERLFSVTARRGWLEPDRASLPFAICPGRPA